MLFSLSLALSRFFNVNQLTQLSSLTRFYSFELTEPFQMHYRTIRLLQQRLPLIRSGVQRTYKHQTKVFGFNPQLQTTDGQSETSFRNARCSHVDRSDLSLFKLDAYHRARQDNPHAALLIDAYRKHGHRLAKVDPLGIDVKT